MDNIIIIIPALVVIHPLAEIVWISDIKLVEPISNTHIFISYYTVVFSTIF